MKIKIVENNLFYKRNQIFKYFISDLITLLATLNNFSTNALYIYMIILWYKNELYNNII